MNLTVNPDNTLTFNQEETLQALSQMEAFEIIQRYDNGEEYPVAHMDVVPSYFFSITIGEETKTIQFNYESFTDFVSEDKCMYIFERNDMAITLFYSANADELWGSIEKK